MGGKGGPLAFLNKKGWHPGNQRNQERVWKKEQEAIAEQKQIAELQKQVEEARQREEMEAMAVAAGVKKKQERLDWMYQGGMVAKQEAEKRADAQMLGEKEIEIAPEEPVSKADEVAALPSFYTTDNAASANEMWSRLHGDPMFAIKQQELMARKKLVANPVQMDAIRKAVSQKAKAKEERRAAKREAKAAKKAAKKAKKEKKRKHSPSSSSESEDDEQERDLKRLRRADQPSGQDGVALDQGGRTQIGDRHRDYNERASNREDHHRSEPYSRNSSRHVNGDYDRNDRRNRTDERISRDDSRDRHYRHRDSATRAEEAQDRHHRNKSDTGRRNSRDEKSEKREQHRSERDERNDRGGTHPDSSHKEGNVRENGTSKHNGVNVHHDSASAQGRDLVYGLNAVEEADRIDREARRRETEKRLEEAAKKKAEDEKAKAAQRYQRKEHKTGRLTEEEKQKRIAEMTGNAAVHEEARWARLHAARKRDDDDEAEEAALKAKAAAAHSAPGARHHQDTAKFLDKAAKDIYNAKDASAADRIGRRKFYNDKNGDEAAFRR